jgi:deoxyhypusine synthase
VTTKKQLLSEKIRHLSLDTFDPVALVDSMGGMAFQARNLHRAATIYEQMLRDPDCTVMLCLAGSLISAGLKKVVVQMVENKMVDCIVATGANMVDQDFFEGLGFSHYKGSRDADDNVLHDLGIDRIYDTYIDEDDLRACDRTVAEIVDRLERRPYTSRELLFEMGRHLDALDQQDKKGPRRESILLSAFRHEVPVFCPALNDSSAGFGLVLHQWHADQSGSAYVSLDAARDFLELTRIKIESVQTGLLMIGGGVPKNFAQDVTACADVIGHEVPMHRYAIQITVADERDGALSGSTLREACSWGKVSTEDEQMVFGEATVMMPLLVGYAYHKQAARDRAERRLHRLFQKKAQAAPRAR